MTNPHPRFAFDTVFDPSSGAIVSAPRPRRALTPEEVEQVRAQAFAEGEASAVARAEQAAAAALAEIARAAAAALGDLGRLAQDHREAGAGLAMAAARAIAGAALDAFPEAPASAALEALTLEIASAPRLIARASPDMVERLQASLDATAQACGYPGQILVKADPATPLAAFIFDWGDGRASFDPIAAAERVEAALREAVEAERLSLNSHSSASEA
jgi:flagellar assembly protein FliH